VTLMALAARHCVSINANAGIGDGQVSSGGQVTTGPEVLDALSQSALLAVRWAAALAAHREGLPPTPQGPAVEASDLLVGILLAHPDHDGEGRVLLSHFGLTARDVLPPDYPTVSADDLRRRAGNVNLSSLPPIGQSAFRILSQAETNAVSGRVQLYHLLGAFLGPSNELRTSLESAFSSVGENLDAIASSYEKWMRTNPTGSDAVAGRSLADWLRRNNPRQPVQVPTYASDQIDPGQDLIGIAVEADAFAYLVASRDLKPPLAVGLFGNWGSGKSFLMRAIQRRVETFRELIADIEQRASPVWKQIKQIEFNAWEYAQGDLWAGLLERLFRELGSVPMKTSLVASRRAPLAAKIEAEKQSAEAATARSAVLADVEKKRIEAVESARQEAENAREKAETSAQELLQKEAAAIVHQALADVWGKQRVRLLGASGTELLDALGEAKIELRRGSSLLGPFWRDRRHIVLLSLGAFLIPGVALLLLEVANVPPVVSALGGLASVVPVATTTLRTATRWSRERLAQLETAEAKVRQDVQRLVDEADQKVADTQRALSEVREEIANLQAQAEAALQRAADLQARVEELTPARVFVDFADERSTDYRRRLGLLSTVRQDLHELQREVQKRNSELLKPNGSPESSVPNRIVLYIDDLDRCPPHKVVEVLEAVHLLLAFEMFVVVVAVDSRWLSSALTEQLPALRSAVPGSSHPTPQDYLEKIFQLPFWVQPLTDPSRQQLMRGLLAGSVRGIDNGEAEVGDKAGLHVRQEEAESLEAMLGHRGSTLRLEASQLALSPEDLRFIESLAPLLGDTPRRIKRFVNTCQFLLAMRPPLRSEGVWSERHIVCLLAAVNEGLPCIADELFTAATPGASGTLDSLVAAPAEASHERARLRGWLNAHPEWRTMPTSGLALRVDTVRRLRFSPPSIFIDE